MSIKKSFIIFFSFFLVITPFLYGVETFTPGREINKEIIQKSEFDKEAKGAIRPQPLLTSVTTQESNAEPAILQKLEYEVTEKRIVISLFFSKPVKYKKTQIQYPPWLVVDFEQCKNKLKPMNYEIQSEYLTDIRTSQLIIEPPVARTVFHLTQILPVSIKTNRNIVIITFLLPEEKKITRKEKLPELPEEISAKEVVEKKKALAEEEEFVLPEEEIKMAQKEFDEYLKTLIEEKKKLYRGLTPPEVPQKEDEIAKKVEKKVGEPEEKKVIKRNTTEKMNDLVSMDFKDADLETVLEILAKEKGLNIVTTEKITGSITVNFDRVPLRDAFLSILKANGYSYVIEDDIIRIINLSSPKDMLETRIFSTKYIAADAIIPNLRNLLTPKGKIEPFYPYDAVKIASSGLNPGEYSNKFIVTDVAPVLEQISDVLKEIDKKPVRIALEITVVASLSENDTVLGIEWPISLALGSAALSENTQENVIYPRSHILKLGYLTENEYKVLLNYIKLDDTFNMIANAKLMCFSDQVASYKLTQKIMLEPKQEVEVGAWLTFIPRARDDEIIIDLLPIFKEMSGFQEMEKQLIPVISESKTTAKVILKNNEALILSGLGRKRTINKKGIFSFFSKTETVDEQIMIFIHPVIIEQ